MFGGYLRHLGLTPSSPLFLDPVGRLRLWLCLAHLLFAGNDTWRGGGIRTIECPLIVCILCARVLSGAVRSKTRRDVHSAVD